MQPKKSLIRLYNRDASGKTQDRDRMEMGRH